MHFFSKIIAASLLFVSCSSTGRFPLRAIYHQNEVSSNYLTITGRTGNFIPIEALNLPAKVPENKLAKTDVYHIRTRVVIEYMLTIDPRGEEHLLHAISTEELQKEFNLTNEIYKQAGIKLLLVETCYRNYTREYGDHWLDALKYSDCLSIYYILPKAGFYLEGFSCAPWDPPMGILLSLMRDSPRVLAHELGHYFGLFHTFAKIGIRGDLVTDTPKQKHRFCAGKSIGSENCKNIMNYCTHNPDQLTKDQINRMHRYIRSYRANHIILDLSETEPVSEAEFSRIVMQSMGLHGPEEFQETP